MWTTASSPDTKYRGYVEVKALIPAKVNGGNLKGKGLIFIELGNWFKGPDQMFFLKERSVCGKSTAQTYLAIFFSSLSLRS